MAATTDFVGAQQVNRRNTMVLLAALTALAALLGYMIGWVLETESSDTVPLLSKGGVAVAALMAAVSVGWSTISLAFGDKMVLAMANAKGHGAGDRCAERLRHRQQAGQRHHRCHARSPEQPQSRRAAGRGGARD